MQLIALLWSLTFDSLVTKAIIDKQLGYSLHSEITFAKNVFYFESKRTHRQTHQGKTVKIIYEKLYTLFIPSFRIFCHAYDCTVEGTHSAQLSLAPQHCQLQFSQLCRGTTKHRDVK